MPFVPLRMSTSPTPLLIALHADCIFGIIPPEMTPGVDQTAETSFVAQNRNLFFVRVQNAGRVGQKNPDAHRLSARPPARCFARRRR